MHPRRPIPLYPQPPTQDNLLVPSDESDFPPIRVHSSTPDLPTQRPRSRYRPSAVAQDNLIELSDGSESSDFPPIRIHTSTPNLPAQSPRSRYRPSAVTQHNVIVLSDESSDFPPIRVRSSTQAVTSGPCSRLADQQDSERQMEPRSPGLPRHSRVNKGLGRKNIVNVTAQRANNLPLRANNLPSSSKRPLACVDDGHSSKRRRLAFKDSEELDQLKAEIGDIKARTLDIKAETESIKECVWEISEHLMEDVDCKLWEIIHRIRESS